MLSLSAVRIPLRGLKVTARQQLTGQDMSGQSSATDQAETGNKGKVLAVSGTIPFSKPEILSNLFNMAGGQQESARQIYRISNKTASTLKVREVKFQGTIRADEQEGLRQWSVAFELIEHLSVPERVEQRQQDQPATQQQVQGVTTPVEAGQSEDVPPDTSIELTGVMKVLKSIDDALT